MTTKIPLSDSQYKELILEMLLKISVEQDALKMLVMNEYANRDNKEIDSQKELNNLNAAFDVLVASSRITLSAQLKNKYGLGSIDDLLSGV